MADPAVAFVAGKFGSPFDIGLQLLDNASVATTEGLWLPSRFAKTASVEVSGSMSTMSVSLLGTNQLAEPLNQMTLTIGGTITAGDVVTAKASNGNLPGGSASVSYTVAAGDTTTTIGAALSALMNASQGMTAIGLTAQAAAGVITASFPSIFANDGTNASGYATGMGPANITTFSGSVSGAATETVTVAGVTTIGSAVGSAITALGLTQLTVLPRWIRARLTTLTGAAAFINATLCGAA
ncbi:MAG TPA: hypothetical protein VL614_14985 [Acetobacteraceae bacterium]|jgi:hypothetical protein|nr:hypothetical protein [Acetobacteraceae bacterium]